MIELSDKSSLLIVRPSILNVITLSIVSRSPKIKWPYRYHLCLEPILFFSFFFSNSGAWSSHVSTPSPWSSLHVAISIHECHLAPSLELDQPISNPHFEHRVSPNMFHQLTKTKLGLLGALLCFKGKKQKNLEEWGMDRGGMGARHGSQNLIVSHSSLM